MSESTMTVNSNGTKIWENEAGELHRLDGPAVEWADGKVFWYQDSKLHRLDGPAIERPDGTKKWYQNGLLHRLDGPAIENDGESFSWFHKGLYLGEDIKGFWRLWNILDEDQRQNVNLHMWLIRLCSV